MKRLLLSLLLISFCAFVFAQSVTIVTKDLDTIIQTKVSFQRIVTSTFPDDSIITVFKKYVPPNTSNKPPIANAGNDASITQPVNSIKLDGSASFDPDGATSTLKYYWRKSSGPAATLTDTNKSIATASNLTVGNYEFELRVVDLSNAFTADRVTVIVLPAETPNLPPTAAAVATPATITLPTHTANLNARQSLDQDGNIVSYLWQKTSGPNAGTISDPAGITTDVTNMSIAGTYVFRVIVTDNKGTKDTANVAVIVNNVIVDPGNTFQFNLSQMAISDPDVNRPGAGAEQWHDRQDVNLGYSALDVYWRFAATRIAGSTKGTYNWSFFDNLFEQAKAKKQKVSFGIMTCYPGGNTDVGLVAFDGGTACYPQWLHQEMQAESVKDWRTGSTWTPNYNSPKYLQWLADLNKAVNDHIIQKGYQNMVNAIDIRGYGAWGEWHSGYTPNNVISDYPSGTFPTTASLKKIVDAHVTGFPNFQLVCMIAAFDANYLGNTMNPPEIAHYILTHPGNAAGKIGWRRDQWGATDNYLSAYLENNTRSFNGVVFNNLIMERWKTAPITGEPPAWIPDNYSDLERQIKLYHATSFGNGNYGTNSPNSTIQTRVKSSSRAAGYRLTATGGEFTVTANSVSITNNWRNTGLAPTYENWSITYELVSSNNVITTLGVSTFKLRLFLPGSAATQHTDKFSTTVPPGTYTLRMVVKDPAGYRAPLPLMVQGRNADGSYNIKTFTK